MRIGKANRRPWPAAGSSSYQRGALVVRCTVGRLGRLWRRLVQQDDVNFELINGGSWLEISAFGFNVGDPTYEHIYPWDKFRVGIIGNLE